MSEFGLLVLVLLFVLVPFLVLYLAIDRETSNPTVVNRSEAEQIAQNRGGRPAARETSRESENQETDDRGEWGTGDEWGESTERDDRR